MLEMVNIAICIIEESPLFNACDYTIYVGKRTAPC